MTLEALLRETNPAARRRHGHHDPARASGGRGLSRRALPRLEARAARQQRPAVAHAAARWSATSMRSTSPPGADIIETNTFNSTSVALADYGMESAGARAQPRGRAPRHAKPRDEWQARTRASRASSPACWGRPTRPPRISPGRERPGISRHQLRRAGAARTARRLDGLARRRRRPAPGRDHLRHAERQGGAVRDRADLRARAACACR